jgi:hypothetical protein
LSRVEGKSNPHDFALAAQVCIPIINAVLVEIKKQSYPGRCFLNIDVPNNVANHKVYYNYFFQFIYLAYDLEVSGSFDLVYMI